MASAFAPPRRLEAMLFDCEVVGSMPSDLRGAFVRVGGEWFYPPKFADDAPLNSDGYVSAFRFRGARVDYKGRWIRTPRFEANLAAGRQLYGYYRNAYTDDPIVSDPAHPNRRTVSNTAPVAHAGKLFSLKEDGLPIQLDPVTLDTLTSWDFSGRWKSETFTAHPKIDPASGEMVAFGYEATGPASDDLFVYIIAKDGTIASERRLKVPYVSMIHDMALTQKHILFPFGGYVTSAERLRDGQIHWSWDKSKPSYVGILPRDGDAKDVRWFKGPERCLMHTFNARSESHKVVLEAPFWDSNFFPFFPNVDGSPWNPQGARAFIRRLTFDLNSNDDVWREEILFPTPVVDLGRIDTRFMSLPTRYGFTSYFDAKLPLHDALKSVMGPRANAYGRFDLAAGTIQSYVAPSGCTVQECCFVPRRADAPEGDGYLLGVVSNHIERRSELLVLDATRLEEGTIARVILPLVSDAQVHGIWVPEEELALL
jgi:carotenoid cleavage dioxygenase-like enzyme